jgi:hypothetical protein
VQDRRDARVASTDTWLLAVQHLAEVESQLLDAKARMIDRLRGVVSRLAPGDPDREVLESCINDLQAVLGDGTIARPGRRRARQA